MDPGIGLLLASFGAGIAASVSPCVYPMLPITVGFLSSRTQRQSSVVLYFLGQTIALVGMGVASVWLGEALGFTSQDPRINLIVGVFLMLAGIIGLAGKIPFFQSSWNNSGLLRWLNSFDGYFAPLFVGLAAVLVMSPCTTPLLSTVLALTSTTESASWGMAAMVSYSVGFSAVVLALGFGLMSVRKMPRSGPWLNGIHYLGCAALLGAGVYFILQSR